MTQQHFDEQSELLALLKSYFADRRLTHSAEACPHEIPEKGRARRETASFFHTLFCERCQAQAVQHNIAASQQILNEWSPDPGWNKLVAKIKRLATISNIRTYLAQFNDLGRFLSHCLDLIQLPEGELSLARVAATAIDIEILNLTEHKVQQNQLRIVLQNHQLEVGGFSKKFSEYCAYLTFFSKTELTRIFPGLDFKDVTRFLKDKLLSEGTILFPSYSIYSQQTIIEMADSACLAVWELTPELLGILRNRHMLCTIIILPEVIS